MKHPVTFNTVNEIQNAVDFLQKSGKEFGNFLEEHQSQLTEIHALDQEAKEAYKKRVTNAILQHYAYNPPAEEIARAMFFASFKDCFEVYTTFLKDASMQMKQDLIKVVATNKDIYITEANDFLSKENVLLTDVAKYFFRMDKLEIAGMNYPDLSLEYSADYVLTSLAENKLDGQIAEVEKDAINLDQFSADTFKKLNPWLQKRIGADIENLYGEKASVFEMTSQKPGLSVISNILKNN